eukprot:CAMPEP_0174266178 /NCGR_PEP_ID=MMETSP0439-20130205/29279_1 /TAXON_ID=0 /ORGANISM="Stereomyxa ramosa, Strain Chinc5" /LENGTH=879 /DNA_ID=CAMNT_0015352985 /DNA_START=33 /DNA_END=2672 /DNA_ORIENTATION=-
MSKVKHENFSASLGTVSNLVIQLKEARNVMSDGKGGGVYCEFSCGAQKVFSSLESCKKTEKCNEEEEGLVLFNEYLNLFVEQRAREVQVIVHQVHGKEEKEKVIGNHVIRIDECKEFEVNEFCVELFKTKNSKLFFEIKYWNIFEAGVLQEQRDQIMALSPPLFLEMYRKDLLGFPLESNDLKPYVAAFCNKNRERTPKKRWHTLKTQKDYLSVIKKGFLPDGHRSEAWLVCCGAKARKEENSGMYWAILELHQSEDSPHIAQIEKDILRTFPEHRVFSDPKGQAPLKRVLSAYSWKNETIGYCQAMNFIGGFLLLFMDEESVFWMLSVIVETLVPDYYAPIMIGAQADQRVFRELVSKKMPALHHHIVEVLSVSFHQITMKWFLKLYIGQVPPVTLLKILDLFFIEGSTALLRVGLALLKMNEKEIMATTDFEECWNVIDSCAKNCYDAEQLMRVGFEFNFKDLKLESKRGNAYREIEDVRAIATLQSLRTCYKSENGKNLRSLVTMLKGMYDLYGDYKFAYDMILRLFKSLNSDVDEGHVSLLFKMFNMENTEAKVEFHDLICGLSVIFNGVPLEKLQICFMAFDHSGEKRLDLRTIQALTCIHYKWVLRAAADNTGDWNVDNIVQQHTEPLWRKVKPYIEQKGGALDFVEYRFKVVAELEIFEQWLRAKCKYVPKKHGLLSRSAAYEREKEEGEEDGRRENSWKNQTGGGGRKKSKDVYRKRKKKYNSRNVHRNRLKKGGGKERLESGKLVINNKNNNNKNNHCDGKIAYLDRNDPNNQNTHFNNTNHPPSFSNGNGNDSTPPLTNDNNHNSNSSHRNNNNHYHHDNNSQSNNNDKSDKNEKQEKGKEKSSQQDEDGYDSDGTFASSSDVLQTAGP